MQKTERRQVNIPENTPKEKGRSEADFRHIIVIANTDLDGTKKIGNALRKIKGVHFMLSNAICRTAGIDSNIEAGKLSETEIRKIDEIIKSPQVFGIPSWLFNRRRDYESGEDVHLTGSYVKFVQENDIRRMRMIKSYKGIRSALGLTVRGQRTRSNFRKNKGRVVGVIKSKVAKAAAAEKESKK